MLSILLPMLLTQLACQVPVEEEPTYFQLTESGDGVSLRSQPSNIDDTILIEVIDAQGFAVQATDFSIEESGTTSNVSSDAFGGLLLTSAVSNVSWNDVSLAVQTTQKPVIPEIVNVATRFTLFGPQ